MLDTPEEKKRESETKLNVGERTLVGQITAREGRITKGTRFDLCVEKLKMLTKTNPARSEDPTVTDEILERLYSPLLFRRFDSPTLPIFTASESWRFRAVLWKLRVV